jgi:putative FmdB family regulatory protein
MPTYDFRCFECEEVWEKNIPLACRNDIIDCPVCQSKNTKRFIGGMPYGRTLSDKEQAGKNAGLDPEKMKYVQELRKTRQKDSNESDYSRKSNELWAKGTINKNNRLNLPKKNISKKKGN